MTNEMTELADRIQAWSGLRRRRSERNVASGGRDVCQLR